MDLLKRAGDALFGSNTKLESSQDQTPDERKLCGFVKDKIDEIRMSGSRISKEGNWLTNVAYLLGYDGVMFDTATRQFKTTDKAGGALKRNRIHINKILPTIQNRQARLCKNPPKYDVRPKSGSQEDKDASRLAQQIITMIWDKERINKKRLDMVMCMQQYGDAYFKVSWDDTLGADILNPATGETEKEGDIRIDVCTPLEIYTDPLAKNDDEVQYQILAKIRKLDYFKTHYPERGPLVKEEDAWLISAQYEQRIQNLSTNGGSGTNAQQQMKNAAIELSYYEKPSKKHPKGRHIIVANGVLLKDGELPINEIPIIKFSDVLIGGRYNSESIITHLRPIQDQFNRTIKKRADWVNRLLAGKYVAPKGHGMSAETLNDQSGEVVEFTIQVNAPNGGAPVPMQVPNIPQYAYLESDKLKEEMYDIAGINEVSRGQLPAAGIPAIGMQFLMEQDDTRIGTVTESNEFSYADLGRVILKFAETYYKTKRLLKIAGKGMEYSVKEFEGADINGNNDVIVVKGSTLPGSKVLKRQEILNAYSQGLLGDPADPKLREKVLSMLEYGDVAEMWHDLAVDMSQINRYIDLIESEELPPLSDLDNHGLFLQELNRYRKSEKYDTLSNKSKGILLGYIEANIKEATELANPGMKDQLAIAQQMKNEAEALDQSQEPTESITSEQELIPNPTGV